ncbi:BTAD domain-containing putative transcriptional regulator [Polymorphospora sp. NPDC050346]|uniref:AfsR/SARP family transcriptional regulator n=1 Tax=Polymorphospora sp. NPDC050346 TaxID=3155780 RepID=UPI0033F3CD6D
MRPGEEPQPSAPDSPPLRLQLLGAFRVRRGGTPLVLPASAARLLAALALHDVTERQELAGRLWPDTTQRRANADLRTALWRLQKVEPRLVVSTRHLLALADPVELDVRLVERWALAAVRPGRDPAELAAPPPVTTVRTLLPGFDDEWVEQPRERLRLLQVQAFESTAAQLLAAGQAGPALPHILQAAQADPLRESANQLLIETHLRQGNVAEALRQYHRYRGHLAALGVAPGLGVTNLIARHLPTGTARG